MTYLNYHFPQWVMNTAIRLKIQDPKKWTLGWQWRECPYLLSDPFHININLYGIWINFKIPFIHYHQMCCWGLFFEETCNNISLTCSCKKGTKKIGYCKEHLKNP